MPTYENGARESGGYSPPRSEPEQTPAQKAASAQQHAAFEADTRQLLEGCIRDHKAPSHVLSPGQLVWARTSAREMVQKAEAGAQESGQAAERQAGAEQGQQQGKNADSAALLVASLRGAVAEAIPRFEAEAREARIAGKLKPEGTEAILAAVGAAITAALQAVTKDDEVRAKVAVLCARIAQGQTVETLGPSLSAVAQRLGPALSDHARRRQGQLFESIPEATELATVIEQAGGAALARATGQPFRQPSKGLAGTSSALSATLAAPAGTSPADGATKTQAPAGEATRGTGDAWSATRAKMESTFGQSFSDVRVHADSAKASGSIHALAQGQDIHFAPGKFNPGSADGDRLIAHELAHVIQQRQGQPTPQPYDARGHRGALEQDAEQAADHAIAGGHARPQLTASSGIAQHFDGCFAQDAESDELPLPHPSAAPAKEAAAPASASVAAPGREMHFGQKGGVETRLPHARLSSDPEVGGTAPAAAPGTFAAEFETRARLALEQFAFKIAPEAQDAFHDYSEERQQALGEGDEVFKAGTKVGAVSPSKIKQAFPGTPDGVVEAALYELHRGELRSIEDIKSDPTKAKFDRGPAAAVEKRWTKPNGKTKGLNTDAEKPTLSPAQQRLGFDDARGTYKTEKRLAELMQSHKQTLVRLQQLLAIPERRLTRDERAELATLKNDDDAMAVYGLTLKPVSQPVGHLLEDQPTGRAASRSVGGIEAALETGASYNRSPSNPPKEQDPWCGSFAAYVYARCGIDFGKGFASAYKLPRKLSSMSGATAFMRMHTNGTGERMKNPHEPTDPHHHPDYVASHKLSRLDWSPMKHSKPGGGELPQDMSLKPQAAHPATAAEIDIRPGDACWQMHSQSEGHVMVVVAVKHRADGVDVQTVEGNAGDKLQSRTHKIDFSPRGEITSDIVGWGRPPQFGPSLPPADRKDPAFDDKLGQATDEAEVSTQ